jgi:aromatic-L-amino-acid decarboxylase
MKVADLAAAVAKDRATGAVPVAVVATAGTTSTTSVDPLPGIADLCEEEKLWLHVDAAYAGAAAICEEYRELLRGWERAHTVVLNPHKWLFTPVDCSILFVRDKDTFRSAFSLVPEYLRSSPGETNLMDLGIQLGRRFRSLKLWMVIRAFGVAGLRERIRYHCRLARELAGWVRDDPEFVLSAPVPFSTVCFRGVFEGSAEEQDRLNELLLQRVNSEGPVLLSQTRLGGRFTLRAAIGNLRTTEENVATAWEIVRRQAVRIRSERS